MSEMELTADRLVVIGRGRLIADTTMADLISAHARTVTVVRSPQADALRTLLVGAGAGVASEAGGALRVTGASARAVGDLARDHAISLHELRPLRSSLEDAYTALTRWDVELPVGAGSRGAEP
jgi:ABC-2 type transport system ATP-binding protein